MERDSQTYCERWSFKKAFSVGYQGGWERRGRGLMKRWLENGHSLSLDSSYYKTGLISTNTLRKYEKSLYEMQSSLRWMMRDMPVLQSESRSGEETGSMYYYTWFVVFFCCSDKVGLSLVSLQQAHALSMTLPERGRGEGVKERIRQPHQRHQVEMDGSRLRPDQMFGEGGKWIMNLGEFGANCADRKGISMNNSLCRGPDHLPPTSTTLFIRPPLTFTIHWPL